ncbi:MAG: hypothetical protein F6K31_04730 [Symploca sp. SIO2G7]|nr:hypothetical protein [Symploca sp. SIO2G7]
MSLFNQILSAIDNPNQAASPGQLAGIINTVQQLGSTYQSNPEAVQMATAIVGKHVRSALQQKRDTEGEQQAQEIVHQFSGMNPSNQAVQALFGNSQIQQIVREIETRTPIPGGAIQAMLPAIVPLVLNLLESGTDPQNPQSSNSVLSSFLDADGDGDVDISDAMKLAGRYIG